MTRQEAKDKIANYLNNYMDASVYQEYIFSVIDELASTEWSAGYVTANLNVDY